MCTRNCYLISNCILSVIEQLTIQLAIEPPMKQKINTFSKAAADHIAHYKLSSLIRMAKIYFIQLASSVVIQKRQQVGQFCRHIMRHLSRTHNPTTRGHKGQDNPLSSVLEFHTSAQGLSRH